MSSLPHKVDSYNSVVVTSSSLPTEEVEFGRLLTSSLTQWKKSGAKAVWLTIPLELASHIPIAVALGFTPYQSYGTSFVLTLWLASGESKLPFPASTALGVGGFVVNDQGEVLAVREKNGPGTMFWKLPGGQVDPKEYLHEAVVREVEEETGIKCEFVSILSMRHMHEARLGNSDLYATCLLKPVTSKIVIQEDEIAAAKWMNIDEFLNQKIWRGVYEKIMRIGHASALKGYEGWDAEILPQGFGKANNALYHGAKL